MIILDTNVVSELMRPSPEPWVLAWVNTVERSTIFTTAVTVYEITFGIDRLGSGPRKDELLRVWNGVNTEFFAERVLVVDSEAARYAAAAKATALSRRQHNSDVCDLLIAGIAKRERAPVATRNVRHFSILEVAIINPWPMRVQPIDD